VRRELRHICCNLSFFLNFIFLRFVYILFERFCLLSIVDYTARVKEISCIHIYMCLCVLFIFLRLDLETYET